MLETIRTIPSKQSPSPAETLARSHPTDLESVRFRAVGWRGCVEGTSRPTEVVKSWIDAFNKADVERLANLYHENAIDDEVANALVDGREAIRQMFATQFANAQMICIPENIFEDGQWAILEWRDPLGLRGSCFFQIVEGKIKLQRGYWDKLSFLRIHGLPSG
jgi:hypothetical protein